MTEIRCKNCGHPAGYHSTPVCGYDHGSGRKPCECSQWHGVSFDLALAQDRIDELTKERDAYMQAVLDAIHALVPARDPGNIAGQVES